jgi:hypothetical protein
MLSQDEMLNNSPMLRISKAFAPGQAKLVTPFSAIWLLSPRLMMFSFRENTLRASRPCRTASRALHSLSR